MASLEANLAHSNPSIVARTVHGEDEARYLRWQTVGRPSWVPDPASATTFPSMREATRAAMRLPSVLRAFGLPREPEIAISVAH